MTDYETTDYEYHFNIVRTRSLLPNRCGHIGVAAVEELWLHFFVLLCDS